MTVEGEKDDISGVGQTQAAHTLCTNMPDDRRGALCPARGRPLRRLQRAPVPRRHLPAHPRLHRRRTRPDSGSTGTASGCRLTGRDGRRRLRLTVNPPRPPALDPHRRRRRARRWPIAPVASAGWPMSSPSPGPRPHWIARAAGRAAAEARRSSPAPYVALSRPADPAGRRPAAPARRGWSRTRTSPSSSPAARARPSPGGSRTCSSGWREKRSRPAPISISAPWASSPVKTVHRRSENRAGARAARTTRSIRYSWRVIMAPPDGARLSRRPRGGPSGPRRPQPGLLGGGRSGWSATTGRSATGCATHGAGAARRGALEEQRLGLLAPAAARAQAAGRGGSSVCRTSGAVGAARSGGSWLGCVGPGSAQVGARRIRRDRPAVAGGGGTVAEQVADAADQVADRDRRHASRRAWAGPLGMAGRSGAAGPPP